MPSSGRRGSLCGPRRLTSGPCALAAAGSTRHGPSRDGEGVLRVLLCAQWPKAHAELSTRPAPANPVEPHAAASVTVGKPRDWPTYGWDNEYGRRAMHVPPFAASRFQITNAEFAEFVQAGGYRDESLWSSDGWRWCGRPRSAAAALCVLCITPRSLVPCCFVRPCCGTGRHEGWVPCEQPRVCATFSQPFTP